jgi:hypothetical protein
MANVSVSEVVTSNIAQVLYDPLRNALERGDASPVLYRAVAEQPSDPAIPNISIGARGLPTWLGVAGILIALLALWKR